MHHLAHAHHAYAYTHHASGGGNWFMHMIMSGIIHAAIYHMMAPLFRGHGIVGSILMGAAIIGIVYIVYRFILNRRYA